jgi:hypothetical protein
MLEPLKLNDFVCSKLNEEKGLGAEEFTEFPLTWYRPKEEGGNKKVINIGNENFRGAWENDERGVQFPVAIYPTYIHPRMFSQRSVFTIQGKRKESLYSLLPKRFLRKLVLNPKNVESIQKELKLLGVHETSLFPDLIGISKELSELH